MSLPSDVTINNLKDFYQTILPYLNVGNGGTSDTPLGQVAFFDDVVAPAGWLIADGTVYNISDYPDLANQYERVHGSKNFYGGNGTTTFAVPDLQGEFLRASGTNSHANQGSGAGVGEHQDATKIPTFALSSNTIYGARNSQQGESAEGEFFLNEADHYTVGLDWWGAEVRNSAASNNGKAGFSTPRPTNTSLLCCVKAVPSSEMNTYSTTERRVGTWIDGKPLYQKTFSNVAMETTLLTGVETLVEAKVINIKGVDVVVEQGVSTSNAIDFVFSNGSVRVTGYSSSYVFGNVNYITLCYTKTTD